MADLSIIEGAAQFLERVRQLGAEGPVIVSRSMNRTMGTLRTRAAQALGAVSGIPPATVKKSLQLLPASPSSLQAVLRIRGKGIPLIRFIPDSRPGAVVNMPVGFSVRPSLNTPAFAQRMPSGHLGIFKRTGVFGRRQNPHLERITELFGPGFDTLAKERGILASLQSEGTQLLERNLATELGVRVPGLE